MAIIITYCNSCVHPPGPHCVPTGWCNDSHRGTGREGLTPRRGTLNAGSWGRRYIMPLHPREGEEPNLLYAYVLSAEKGKVLGALPFGI